MVVLSNGTEPKEKETRKEKEKEKKKKNHGLVWKVQCNIT